MRKKLLLCAVLLFIAPICYAQASKQPLQLTIKSDKEFYSVGDKITIKAIWHNVGKNAHRILHGGIHEGLNLVIKDELNQTIKVFQTKEYKYSLGEKNFHLLGPDKELSSIIGGIIELPTIYNYPYKSKNESQGLYLLNMQDSACYLKPGKYEIQYSYGNNIDYYWSGGEKKLVNDVWQGTLASNTITLEVKEKISISKEEAMKLCNDYMNKHYSKDFGSKIIAKPANVYENQSSWIITYQEKNPQTLPSGVMLQIDKKSGEVRKMPQH